MIEGIFGRVQNGRAIGWAYDIDYPKPVNIVIKSKSRILAKGIANLNRDDLKKAASHVNGKVGYRIQLPKGRKDWTLIDVFANGVKLNKSPQLQRQIIVTHRSLTLSMDDPHFFIHIPKTAGTAFKELLYNHFHQDDFFPNRQTVLDNNGLYPHFDQIIKSEEPKKSPNILIGHYPYATHQIIKGEVKKTVILRDPIQRAISNVFHFKNYDKKMKDLSPLEVYKRGKMHLNNFQVRYLTDKGINLNMKFITPKPLNEKDLESAIANMQSCSVVGISEQLDRTVKLTNKVYNWDLKMPKRVNVAKTEKNISDKLLNILKKENALEQKLYAQACKRFELLCTQHGVI